MKWIYLSHVLCEATPLYGGKGQVKIVRARSMAAGDSSNNSELELPAHAGTHVDAPRHFDPAGASLDEFAPGHWHIARPWLLDVPSRPREILDSTRLGAALRTTPRDCDLLLLRTGAEKWRAREPKVYSEQGPGLGPDIAHWLRRNRRLKFLGMDFISASSYAHREIGREAHRAFLGPHESGNPPVMLIEDMALGQLPHAPQSAWIVPLRYDQADGAPVTVIASIRVPSAAGETTHDAKRRARRINKREQGR